MQQGEPGARHHRRSGDGRSRRRVGIRTKLVVALAGPLAAMLGVTWLEVRDARAEATSVREEAAVAEAALGPSSITTAVYNERAFAALYVLGQEATFSLDVETNDEARGRTDGAVTDFTADLEDRSAEVADAYRPALDALGGLAAVRDRVDAVDPATRSLANNVEATAVFDAYSEIVDALGQAQARVTATLGDEGLRQGGALLQLCNRQSDLLARTVRNLLLPAVIGDQQLNQPAEVDAVARYLGEMEANTGLIRDKAVGPYAGAAERLLATDHVRTFPDFAEQAIATGRVDVGAVGPASTGDDPDRVGWTVFRAEVSDVLTSRAADTRAAADADALLYTVLAGALTLVAVVGTVLTARTITRPLHDLTRQAQDVASERLPGAIRQVLSAPLGSDVTVPELAPIDTRSRDEVADVARALDHAQRTALGLAVEQGVLRRNLADAFVNLGRRNQNLVTRQLDHITALEADEPDPDALGALFHLDHLATRVRRNAESLIVLAGLDPPRQWSAPVRLPDVVRSALGEVEDYRRARATTLEPATVNGNAAADVAHLLAELIDNGIHATPPGGLVEVAGHRRPDGHYLVTVTDQGVGMADHELARANQRLAGREGFTTAPSRYLGHYVVGHLALRHGIDVRLVHAHTGGTTALIALPPSLLDAPLRHLPVTPIHTLAPTPATR